jgi:uncharacterized metal-binding protein
MNPKKNNHAVRLVSLIVLLVVAIVVSFLITDVFKKKSQPVEPIPTFKPTISRSNLDIFNDLKIANQATVISDKERVDIFKAMKAKNKSDTQLSDKQKTAILSAMIQAQK